jgi:hypothetical protein
MKGLQRIISRRFAFFDAADILAEYNSSDGGADKLTPRLELYAKDLPLTTFTSKIIGQTNIRPPRLHHNLERLVRAEGIYPVSEINKLNGDS